MSFSLEAAREWKRLTALERMRVELAARRVSLQRLSNRAAPFATSTFGILIGGEIGDWGSTIRIDSLKRDPLARPGTK